jgi:hypothetical protein
MAHRHTVHSGTIKVGNETVASEVKANRHILLRELNNWLFDYSYANNLRPFIQLPPLDEWTRSKEDPDYWYVDFPAINATAQIRSELLEFP